MPLAPPRSNLGRRASVTVLAVIAVAVAVLGLLVAQTSRHSIDGARMNVAGHQRMLSERLVALTLIAQSSTPEERVMWAPRIDATVTELRIASQELRPLTSGGAVIPQNTSAARDYESLVALQDSVKESALRAASPDASPSQIDSLLSQQKRLAVALEHVVDELEIEWSRQVDHLLQLEAACVILLLIALGFGIRQALQPTQAQLNATVEALEESESRTRAIFDAMSDGMLISDKNGDVIAWNPSALQILEVSEENAAQQLKEKGRQLTDENGAPLEQAPSRMTLQSGKPLEDLQLAVALGKGKTKWLSVNTNPLYRGESEDPHAAVTIFRDVTTARRVEEERLAQAQALEMQNQELLAQAEALERGHALFRSLVETAGSVIVGLDADGRVFEWNREAEVLFGVTRANALGRDYATEFVTTDHRSRMRKGITGVLNGQPIRNLLGPVKSTTDERHMVLWNITPLRAGIGEPVHGLIAAGTDVTEREASDERFRLLFERSTDAHMLYDAAGIIDCNEATLRMLRVPRRESLVGRRPADLSPLRQPDGRLSVVVGAQMREKARITGNHRFEWVHRRDDGTEFPVEVTLTPLRLHGRDVILAVWHDIAERKKVEDALRLAKDAAESANRTKSEFMTRMNHELRTPLTAIIGFSKVLLQGRAGVLSSGAQLYTERILDNGMHLLSLINQILDVAKVEAGRMELDRDTVALDALVNETLAMLESTAESKGLTLRKEVPDRVVPFVTDAGKLRQILINLVGNAIKFTAQGEVLVRVIADPVTSHAREIIVRDTGMGIPAERQDKIFEPFEQGDSSTRRQFGGTGLGLSIVKSFVHLIGATLDVESEVGVGTTFTIRLPVLETVTVPAEVGSPGGVGVRV
ncbi:MAG: PAS domain S-box protein [Gemmatimonadota bacterium]